MARLDADRTVDVQVRRHPGYRRIRLSVQPDGQVRLSAPKRTSHRLLTEFVHRHQAWLSSNVRQSAVAVPETLELLTLGEHWRLEFAADVTRLTADAGSLLLPQDAGPQAYAALRRWLGNRARRELGRLLQEISNRTGLTYSSMSVRGQRSRWGSYSAAGSVSLNFKLLFLPEELTRYVLLHELCHGVQLNHSPAYWAEVARHEPRLAELRAAMRSASNYVPAWLERT